MNIPTEGGIIEAHVDSPSGNLVSTLEATKASGKPVGGVYGASTPMEARVLRLGVNELKTLYLVYKAPEDDEIDEDKIMEDALESGAEDIKCEEGEYTIYTATEDLDSVRDAIIALGYKIDTADVAKVPSTYVELTSDEDIENMEKMLDKFNEDDDVNAVYTNWDH